MVILCVSWNRRMNRFTKMALVLYCTVLLIIPLSYLHLENLLQDNTILTNQEHQEINLLVIIHEVLFAHLRNITDHLSRSAERAFEQLIDQTPELLFPDVTALRPCLLSLALLSYVLYTVRRYIAQKGKALPHTVFCYRLFDHSPPHLFSLHQR